MIGHLKLGRVAKKNWLKDRLLLNNALLLL